MDLDEGYDSDIFQDKALVTAFKCPICTCVCRDPVETQPCGHLFCSSCMDAYTERGNNPCPSCRVQITATTPSMFVKRQIMQLRVKCVHCGDDDADGQDELKCDWVGELNYLDEHLNEKCPVVTLTCPHCEEAEFLRAVQQGHFDTCPKYPIPCSLCHAEIPRDEIDNHMNVLCDYQQIPCPSECGARIGRVQMEEHLQTCPNVVVSCAFALFGCREPVIRDAMMEHMHTCEMRHLMLRMKYLERLTDSPELLVISNGTGVHPELSGMFIRRPLPVNGFPCYASKKSRDLEIRWDLENGWVIARGDSVWARRQGKFSHPCSRIQEIVVDLGLPSYSVDESKDLEDDVNPFDRVWHVQPTDNVLLQNSILCVDGFSQREYKLHESLEALTEVVKQFAPANPRAVRCICGIDLRRMHVTDAYWNVLSRTRISCDACGNRIKGDVFHCPNQYNTAHVQGYDLCPECADARLATQTYDDVHCDCGRKLVAVASNKCYSGHASVICNRCEGNVRHNVVYHCPGEKNRFHREGFDLCTSCALADQKKSGMSWLGLKLNA